MQNLPFPIDLGSLGGWVIVAIAALVILVIVLRVIRKAISVSLRLAIILGAVAVIVASLYALNLLFRGGGLPVP